MTPSELAAGAALAAALMAANIPCDSGEDVDRLIAELDKRGYRLVGDQDDDEMLAASAEAHAETLVKNLGAYGEVWE